MAFVNLASTVMPDLIVVAGGVSDHLPALLPGIEDVLRRHAVMAPTNFPVVAAKLGADAGPIGAAQLAFKRLG
jgi:predicted NBD/HSP70 family sugar kinase